MRVVQFTPAMCFYCAVALALLPLASAATAEASCPCVEWAALEKYTTTRNGERCILYSPGSGVLDGAPAANQDAFCYPPDYGSSQCKAWDTYLEPSCADAAGNALPVRVSQRGCALT